MLINTKIMYIIIGIIVIIVGYIVTSMTIVKKKMNNYDPKNDSKEIINLTDNTFSKQINQGITLVDFWASWCQPCKIQAPIISNLADDINKKAKICKLNIEENPQIAKKLKIKNIPTIIIFKNGKEIERLIGLKTKNILKKTIEKHL